MWWTTGFNTAVLKDSLGERRMEKKKKRPPSPIPRQGNLRRARPLRRIQNHVCGGGDPHTECWMAHSPIPAWQRKMHVTDDQRK